ncbi:MAG TPA: twin-arginine translocase TatA/TatE family subunit [Actinomycetota bacterium]|nr:twin-arginine translocase TatA/TatE family subunit [Actinomycetota bacterium]
MGELIVIVIVALMVFGPKRLPEMMRSAGKAFRMFQTESQKAVAELREAVDTSDIQNDLRKIVMDEPDELARKAEERAAAAAAANAAAAAASTPPVLDPIPPHAAKKTAAKKTAAKKTAAKKTAAAAPLAAQPPGGYPVTEDT